MEDIEYSLLPVLLGPGREGVAVLTAAQPLSGPPAHNGEQAQLDKRRDGSAEGIPTPNPGFFQQGLNGHPIVLHHHPAFLGHQLPLDGEGVLVAPLGNGGQDGS